MSRKASNGHQKFKPQADQLIELGNDKFSFEPGANELYSHSNQLSSLLKSMNLKSLDQKSISTIPISQLKEIKSYINSIVKDLINLGVPPSNETHNTIGDTFNLLSFASIILINQFELQKSNHNHSTNLLSLESEIESLKIQNKQLEQECQNRRSRINSLRSSNDELTKTIKENDQKLFEKDHKIYQLEKQIKSQESIQNISSIEKKPEIDPIELELKNKEIKKLKQALNSLSKEITSLSDNFQKESKQKNQLVTIIHKQSNALREYEQLYQDFQTKLHKMEVTLQTGQTRISKLESKPQKSVESYSDLIESLQFLLTTKKESELLMNCNKILSYESDSGRKIIDLVDYLFSLFDDIPIINHENEIREIHETNSRLTQYIQSMVEFFENLANSAEMKSWMIDVPCNEDLRPFLLSQCNKVEHFLKTCQTPKHPLISIAKDEHLDFLSLSGQIEIFLNKNEIEIGKNEMMSILHLASTANDALRRCAEHVIDINRQLEQQMHNMREEMRTITTDCQNHIYEATEKVEIELEKEREQRKQDQKLIADIRNELLTTENVSKCIYLIDGDTATLKKKHESKKQKKIELKEKSQNEVIQKLNNELSSIQQQVRSYEEEISNCTLIQKEYESLKKEVKTIEKVASQNKQKLELKLTNIQLENIKLTKENESISSQLNDLQLKLNETTKEKDQLHQQFKDLIQKNNKEIQELQSHQKNEIENEQIKNNDLKNKYEKEIDELKTFLSDQKTENEEIKIQLQNEISEKESVIIEKSSLMNQNKQLSSELTSVKIDNKILRMKIDTIEEKVMRDKNLSETQCKLKLLNMQSKHESEIEAIKSDNDCQNHRFRMSIIQYFKEYVNFGEEITPKAVFEVLDRVASDLDKLSKKCESQSSIIEAFDNLKKLFFKENESFSHDQIYIQIINLLKIKEEYKKLKKEFNDLRKSYLQKDEPKSDSNEIDIGTPYEWMQWAKKVASIYSGNSITSNSPRELQFSIEEALMGGLNQRLLIKRLEILRTEKKYLLSNACQPKQNSNLPLKFTTLVVVLSSIWKLRKVSGQLLYNISQKKNINENHKTNE